MWQRTPQGLTHLKHRSSGVFDKMSETKRVATTVVALIVGLVVGLFIPYGQVAPSTITKRETIPTTITQTQTQINTVTKPQTMTQTIRVTNTQTISVTETSETTKAQTTTATGEALAVDAHTFYEEYKTDEEAADAKYLFKVVQVTGEIASLNLVLYEVVYGSDEVVCSFVQTRETEGSKLATLRVGDVVTIEGKCLGRFHVAPYCVYLSECTLVSVVTKAETSATTSTATQTTSATTVTTTITSVSYKYVGSVNSNVYHYPWCSHAKRIKPENKIWFIDENDAKSKGYRPCLVCSPPG